MDDMSATTVSVYGACRGRALGTIVTAVGIALGATFFVDLSQESHFVDESAYVSQAYFGDLFVTGDHDSLLWFEYPAFDLPPLTKYLVWAGLVAGGDARPGPTAMRAWYADTSKRFETPESLRHARIPVALCGLLTVVAAGRIAFRWRGFVAALVAMTLLTIHPLFRTHSRRAMADVPAEMGVAAALAMFLWLIFAPRGRASWLRVVGSGLFAGLAASSKLNGLLAGMVIAVWAVMAVGRTKALSIGFAAAAGVVGASVFVLTNPFFYADPKGLKDTNFAEFEQKTVVERIAYVLEHRVSVSAKGQELFPNDALTSLPQKAAALVVQGFGRFSPFGPRIDDSRVRFDVRQDWPVVVWLPWVAAGAWVAWNDRQRDGRMAGPYVLAYWIVAVVTVGAFLPLAWNRYYLPIVIPSILLAAGAASEAAEAVVRKIRPNRSTADV
jgi:4-amino-4-deoxy-L-arabinose transferase-like glycosyltransferase